MAENSIQESHLSESDPLTITVQPMEFETRLAVEDCICPICLDYFIDVVETRCHHRFCKFCLENWLRVSFLRHCPTCRTNVGTIRVLTELQEAINTTILPILNSDAILERQRVRNDRLLQLERMAEREHERLSLPLRPRYLGTLRYRRFGEREFINPNTSPERVNLLSRQILNWWEDNNSNNTGGGGASVIMNTEPVTPFQSMDDVEVDDTPQPLSLPFGIRWRLSNSTVRPIDTPEVRSENPAEAIPSNVSGGARQPTNSPETNVGDSNAAHLNRSGASPRLDIMYEEALLEEYTFHLRRSQSAYNRVREGYRDFYYHNSRMQQIFDEHRTFFNRTLPDHSLYEAIYNLAGQHYPPTRHVDYNDFEDIMEEEARDMAHATNPFLRRLTGGVGSARQFHSYRDLINPVEQIYPSETQNLTRETNNVLDMEQELENRRRMAIDMGSSPVSTSRSTGSPGIFGCPSNSISSSSRTFGTTHIPRSSMPHQGVTTSGNRGLRNLRPSSARHHILVERLRSQSRTSVRENHNLLGNDSPPASVTSRRLRRRMQRSELIRPATTGESENTNIRPATVSNTSSNFANNGTDRNNNRRTSFSFESSNVK